MLGSHLDNNPSEHVAFSPDQGSTRKDVGGRGLPSRFFTSAGSSNRVGRAAQTAYCRRGFKDTHGVEEGGTQVPLSYEETVRPLLRLLTRPRQIDNTILRSGDWHEENLTFGVCFGALWICSQRYGCPFLLPFWFSTSCCNTIGQPLTTLASVLVSLKRRAMWPGSCKRCICTDLAKPKAAERKIRQPRTQLTPPPRYAENGYQGNRRAV